MLHLPWNKKYVYSPLIPVDEPTKTYAAGAFRGRSLIRYLRMPLAALLLLSILSLCLFPRGGHGEDHPWLDSLGNWRSPVEGVQPIPCHSHNDYLRSPPLYAALGTGCASVEADIWLAGEELYVAHYRGDRTRNITLSNVYIEPLVGILEAANSGGSTGAQGPHAGVFAAAPLQSLVLLVDFKTAGAETWPYFNEALEPLRQRGWLAHWNGTHRIPGPVTVVGTGSLPYNLVTANETYRDVFFDAPLKSLKHKSDTPRKSMFRYNPSNSHYASAKLSTATGIDITWRGLRDSGLKSMRQQIHEAKIRGLLPRYWGTPGKPRKFRKSLWQVLLKEGVGVLNVDDLAAVRKLRWTLWKQPAVNEQPVIGSK
ncbi:hypothetical protein BKA81DRAFT_222941 [Phyllosticta paracitricarpa]|uniref:Altered inheritance of mitochondria protein 6 n=1 Tax=Phyllosticta paracitricarpa TaxID=2016321 RepID=A0ABR1NAB2_9PEZI